MRNADARALVYDTRLFEYVTPAGQPLEHQRVRRSLTRAEPPPTASLRRYCTTPRVTEATLGVRARRARSVCSRLRRGSRYSSGEHADPLTRAELPAVSLWRSRATPRGIGAATTPLRSDSVAPETWRHCGRGTSRSINSECDIRPAATVNNGIWTRNFMVCDLCLMLNYVWYVIYVMSLSAQ